MVLIIAEYYSIAGGQKESEMLQPPTTSGLLLQSEQASEDRRFP